MIKLLESWKVRLLIAALVAAVVTPPDPWSLIILLVPLFALGETVAFCVRRGWKARLSQR